MGYRIKSSDGANWIELAKNDRSTLRDIVYGKGRFVAVGDNGRRVIFDGEKWTNDQEDGGTALRGVAYGKGRFVAIGPNRHSVSYDGGVTWDDVVDGYYVGLNGIAYESELPMD